MLPEILSSDAASLHPGRERSLTLTAELRIDPEGRVTAVDLYESLLRSHARLTYDAVAELFAAGASDGVPAAVVPTLRWLRTAAARLSSVRAARGGVDLGRDEAYVSFDPATREPTGIAPRGENEAHRLVERLMVAANEAVATWLADRGLPGVFRVHDQPAHDRVEMLSRVRPQLRHRGGLRRRAEPPRPRRVRGAAPRHRGRPRDPHRPRQDARPRPLHREPLPALRPRGAALPALHLADPSLRRPRRAPHRAPLHPGRSLAHRGRPVAGGPRAGGEPRRLPRDQGRGGAAPHGGGPLVRQPRRRARLRQRRRREALRPGRAAQGHRRHRHSGDGPPLPRGAVPRSRSAGGYAAPPARPAATWWASPWRWRSPARTRSWAGVDLVPRLYPGAAPCGYR